MTDPVSAISVAGATFSTAAKSATEVILSKSQQKTIRFQSKIGIAAECATRLQEIVTAAKEYAIVAAEEKTKRREIEAWEKITLTKIKLQSELLLEYLDRSFDERKENFRNLFSVVDQSIQSGNNEQLGLALAAITELAKSSPFKDLANLNTVQAALQDPNHEWRF
jgi:hypothetical protein